jgi:hypothetical protein
MVKVLVSVCKANKGKEIKREKEQGLATKVRKKIIVFSDGEKDLFSWLTVLEKVPFQPPLKLQKNYQ